LVTSQLPPFALQSDCACLYSLVTPGINVPLWQTEELFEPLLYLQYPHLLQEAADNIKTSSHKGKK